jgi:hypothetical protein
VSPPEYRGYPALRRHPAVLAWFALLHTEASQAAVDRGLSEARATLRGVADARVMSGVLEVLGRERSRLLGVRRAVGLVEEALRGRRYVAPME